MTVKLLKIFSKSQNIYRKNTCSKWYDAHPDLAPRNVYLYLGREVKMEEVEKKLDKLIRPSMFERLRKLFKIKK